MLKTGIIVSWTKFQCEWGQAHEVFPYLKNYWQLMVTRKLKVTFLQGWGPWGATYGPLSGPKSFTYLTGLNDLSV